MVDGDCMIGLPQKSARLRGIEQNEHSSNLGFARAQAIYEKDRLPCITTFVLQMREIMFWIVALASNRV